MEPDQQAYIAKARINQLLTSLKLQVIWNYTVVHHPVMPRAQALLLPQVHQQGLALVNNKNRTLTNHTSVSFFTSRIISHYHDNLTHTYKMKSSITSNSITLTD